MSEAELKRYGYNALYLCSCVLNGEKPDKATVENMELAGLLKFCRYHSLSAIVAYALESVGVKEQGFEADKNNAIRKVMLLDAERKQIATFFEENQIWYMPLKGVHLKNYYPKIGMRQMCDNDILIDSSFLDKADKFMVSRGYTPHRTPADMGYEKPPIYNFEIHWQLFAEFPDKKWHDYYENIRERLIGNGGFELNFTAEDFYVYIVTHEYKHFKTCGTGLRSLIDCYVYLNRFGSELDWDYIEDECEKLDIRNFELKSRELAQKVFSSTKLPELSADERERLEYYLLSGTYGNSLNKAKNNIKSFSDDSESSSKIAYLMHRLFPPMEYYKTYMPFFYRYKFLLPIGWLSRIFQAIFLRPERLKAEFGEIKKIHK